MSGEKDKTQPQPEKNVVVEKGQYSGALNESKLPDFKFTPTPPPPPPQTENTSGSDNTGE
ncbi:MAG: hypothetical protein IPP32_03240 [Bacteroidetes bacterium]|nr:hypothetical protein [Bacteroidota bacterium]